MQGINMYPRLIHLYGPVWIYSYGTMIAIGFFLFLFFSYRHPLRKKFISSDQFFNLIFVGFFASIIGGRILFVLTNLDAFRNRWIEILFPWEGGFTLLGGIIGALTVAPLYLYVHKIPILPILDLTALYAPLMQSIARIGCLLAGCCYGALVENPTWLNTITFSHPEGFAPCGLPLYPTQIYMSLASFFIFFVMLGVEKLPILKKPGQFICLYLVMESFARFAVDFWRGDQEKMYHFAYCTLSQSQLFSMAFGIFAFLFFIWTTHYQSNNKT